MSSFFFLSNLHFSLEIFGALVFGIAAWLAIDAFHLRRDFTTASRAVGFALLTVWQIIHALDPSQEIWFLVGFLAYIMGLTFLILNLLLEHPSKRPEFKAIVALPAAGALLEPLNIITTVLLAIITILAHHQYKEELKKSLGPFILGFLFLTLGGLSAVFYADDLISPLWIIGHALELIGFLAIGWWVWKYLELRIREEMLLIFTSFTLLMAVVVSLSFSSILVSRVEAQTKANLLVNAKVLDLSVKRLKEESLAKTQLLATRTDINNAFINNDFSQLESLGNSLVTEVGLGFLTFLNPNGDVILRAHALTKKDDSLVGEEAVTSALEGESTVAIESSTVERFAVRAAVPLFNGGALNGVIVAGFPLDNALADDIKRITGLEMSIFDGNERVATTAFNPDGRTRSVGVLQTDPKVTKAVLEEGEEITISTQIVSRPFLASYVPIKTNDGKVIGMLSSAQPQQEVLETVQSTNSLTLIAAIIIMLIFVSPIYLITKRLSGEVT